MSKFNLYAHECEIAARPSRQTAVAGAVSARMFSLGLGVWFGLMFVLACLILTLA